MSIAVNEQKEGLTLVTIQDEMTIYNVLEQKNTISPHLKPDHELHGFWELLAERIFIPIMYTYAKSAITNSYWNLRIMAAVCQLKNCCN